MDLMHKYADVGHDIAGIQVTSNATNWKDAHGYDHSLKSRLPLWFQSERTFYYYLSV
jgi:hypothetical protein